MTFTKESFQKFKYAPVIGSDKSVKVGTIEEYLYWRVIPRGIGDVGKEKQFYVNPQAAPGYHIWSQEPHWQENIRKWEQRRNALTQLYIEKDFIVVS
jgi:hypothetical protein